MTGSARAGTHDRRPLAPSLRAQRSNPSLRKRGSMDCFRLHSLSFGGHVVALLLATTSKTSGSYSSKRRRDVTPHARGMMRPRVCQDFRPRSEKRAQGRPDARCTRGLVCKNRRKRTRAYRFSGGNPAFPARWCYGLLRALPGDRALLPPSFARRGSRLCELGASIGAPGPHDFAVRECQRSSFAGSASTASHHAFRDVRNAPLVG